MKTHYRPERADNVHSGTEVLPWKSHIPLAATVAIAVIILHIGVAETIGVPQAFWRTGSSSYGTLAHSIVEGRGLSLDSESPTAYRPPLYPLFLAAILRLTSHPRAVVIAQSTLAGLTLGILALLAAIITNRRWPMLIVPLQFLLLTEILAEGLKQRETVLFSFFLTLSALIFVSEEQSHHWWKATALGVCLGLTCLTRPLAAIAPLLAVGWGWRSRQRGRALRRIGKQLLLFGLGFTLTIGPWGIRNQICLESFTITSTTAGLNLWKGNNPATADLYPDVDLDVLDRLARGDLPSRSGWWTPLANLRGLSEVERDSFLLQLARNYIKENPLQFLRMGLLKAYALWTPLPVPRGTANVEWTPTGAHLTSYSPYPSSILPYTSLYVLTALGIWYLRDHPLTWFLILWIVFFTAIHFVTFGETRFRWPVNVLSLPLAAAGFEGALSEITTRIRGIYPL